MTGILNLLAGAVGVVKDTYFNLVTLLLPGDGTNGAQNNTFLDSSTNNFTITRNGNTTQGTFSPFSQTGWSNFFNGSSDYITVPQSTNLDLGSGNWTVEAWVYTTSNSGKRRIISKQNATNYWLLCLNASGSNSVVGFEIDTTTVITGTTAISSNTWAHIAIVRNSNTVTCYVNGAVDVSASYSGTPSAPNAVTAIGAYAGGPSEYFPGYISNVRYVKGSAVYTAAFTPSTTPLTAITNTQLLTCQSNRFIDNSSNAFDITANGSPSVQAFSPFAPTAAYSAATVGGSGYFDGTGDYVVAASNAAFALGTGDFSMECWIYFVGTAAGGGLSGEFFGSTTTNAAVLRYKTGTLAISRSNTADDMSASVTMTVGQWYHVCATRTGTTGGLYLNGTRVATNASYTASYAQGDFGTTNNTQGYLASCRLIKGSNPYGTGATLTLPTAPVTNITNTQLLLNFTNAGITDATAKNDLETVGNAQISTTQSKFGGSSIYLDGTGDWMLMKSSPNFAFGTGDFTLEMWAYFASVASFPTLTDSRATSASTAGFNLGLSSAKIQIYTTSQVLIGATALSANTWYHIAVTRSGSTLRIFLNGTQDASTTNSTNWSDQTLIIGATPDLTNTLNGYIDDLRITKGYARYTANFTAPTAAFALQ